MILPKGVQPWLVCDDSGSIRHALAQPWFDGKNVVASDGTALIVTPVTEADKDIKGPIPIDALKEAYKMSNKGLAYQIELTKDSAKTITAKTYPREIRDTYGKVEDELHFPDYDAVIKGTEKHKRTITLGINPELLLKCAKAAGANKDYDKRMFIRLECHVDKAGVVTEAIFLSPMKYYDAPSRVLIMPVEVKEKP